MNALLVYPKHPVTFWSLSYALPFINKKSILPPLGLLTIAGLLPRTWVRKLVDADTPRTFENVRTFIQRSGIVTAMVGLLTALPQTRLYKRLHEAGRILDTSSGNNTDFALNFIPKMRKDLLLEGYSQLVAALCSPENYYKRIVAFLKQYRRRSTGTRITLKEKLHALSAAIWNLGLKESGGRLFFWRMCLWTAFRRPRLMSEAITLAIYGFHYRAVLANS